MASINNECNVLCSGPSRKSYIQNDLPSIGCNFPWTKVDYTIIFDFPAIDKLCENPLLIDDSVKLVIHQRVYGHLKHTNKLDILKSKIDSIFNYPIGNTAEFFRSSGHYAALYMISMGFTKLNIYGCDNYFGDDRCVDNYTHQIGFPHYIENTNLINFGEERLIKRGVSWRDEWHKMIKQHPNIHFNFIP